MKKVLFVDHNGEKALSFTELTKGMDIEVTTVEGSNDAIAALDGNNFDAIVTEAHTDTFDFIAKMPVKPPTIILHSDDTSLIFAIKKQWLWQNQFDVRFVVHPFEPGQFSAFATLIKSI